MRRRLTIRAKILWIAFCINALCTTVYTISAYMSQRDAFLQGVDAKLEAVATALPQLVHPDYHDRVVGPDSIDAKEYDLLLNRLSDYANSIGIKYLYTYMQFDGVFRVAATSATEDERRTHDETAYFTEYEEPPEGMLQAWKTGAPCYVQYKDEWGFFRSIFIPMQTEKGARYIIGADVSLAFIRGVLTKVLLVNVGLGVAIFLCVWVLSYWILSHILKPVERLTTYVRGFGAGGFQFSEDQRTALNQMATVYRDEVGQLASAFSEMVAQLLDYIRNLRETTAAKERIESELKIAHDIQMSLLKKLFPPFPDLTQFDLYAMLVPAKEVGGDLYDFCMLDDEHLFFYVGDVSDKGVPAALFMAVTMALMKRAAQGKDAEPARILELVNKDLSEENDKLLFVTLCCFILNVKTGEFVYSNAGHDAPVIAHSDGSSEWLELPKGIVLGVDPVAAYQTRSGKLVAGDTLLVYTDGVNEAMSPDRQVYSNERLLATTGTLAGMGAKEAAETLMASVKEHAAGAPPSDDITIMTLTYRG